MATRAASVRLLPKRPVSTRRSRYHTVWTLSDKVISSDFNGFTSLAIATAIIETMAKECHKYGDFDQRNICGAHAGAVARQLHRVRDSAQEKRATSGGRPPRPPKCGARARQHRPEAP